MTLLDLGQHRRVKVWRERSALPAFDAVGTANRWIATPTRSCVEADEVALEAVLPCGPIVMYGALGASFVPDASISDLTVSVDYLASDQTGTPYESDLAIPPEAAHVGLPWDLVDAVIGGVNEQLIIGSSLGSGHLSFDRAVYGIVGSSEDIFRKLARAAARLLAEPRDVAEEVLASALLEVLA